MSGSTTKQNFWGPDRENEIYELISDQVDETIIVKIKYLHGLNRNEFTILAEL